MHRFVILDSPTMTIIGESDEEVNDRYEVESFEETHPLWDIASLCSYY